MKSQVSFRYDGSHNESNIKKILTERLNKPKFRVEEIGYNVYRIYVGADNTDKEVMEACYTIQCFSIYDNTKSL